MSDADAAYGKGLSSRATSDPGGMLEAAAFATRLQIFNDFAEEEYEKLKQSGQQLPDYDEFRKSLYKGFEITRTDANGNRILASTAVPSSTEVRDRIDSAPPELRKQLQAAQQRLESGKGTIADIKIMEENLGNGSWMHSLR